jgi:hypothetical protein
LSLRALVPFQPRYIEQLENSQEVIGAILIERNL